MATNSLETRGAIGTWVCLIVFCVFPGLAGAQVSLGLNRLLVVGAGGTATQNCQAFRDALASVTGSAGSPYLLRLEPGEYDCGSTAVVMKPYVDVEGSGQGVTRVFGDHDGDLTSLGVIDLVGNMELSNLTVENTGNMSIATALSATTAGESRVTRATLISDDSTSTSCGMFVSLLGGGAAGSVVVRVSEATIRGNMDGLFLQNGTGKVVTRESTIEGVKGKGVVLVAGDEVVVAYSQLVNGFNNAGSLTCLYSYDGTLAELDSGCSPPPPPP